MTCHAVKPVPTFLSSFSPSRRILDWKSRAKPVQAWIGPECFRSLRFPHFKTRLSALGTGCLYPPGNILGTRFCCSLSQPQGRRAAGRNMPMKNSIDTVGNRTRNIPACSVVSQPTGPPRAPNSWLIPSNSEQALGYVLSLIHNTLTC